MESSDAAKKKNDLARKFKNKFERASLNGGILRTKIYSVTRKSFRALNFKLCKADRNSPARNPFSHFHNQSLGESRSERHRKNREMILKSLVSPQIVRGIEDKQANINFESGGIYQLMTAKQLCIRPA